MAELKNWQKIVQEKEKRIAELEGAFERIVERLEEAGSKYFEMGDIYGFSSINEAIYIVKEEGGME